MACGGGVNFNEVSIDILFDRAANQPSDINEHCAELLKWSARSEHVTDMGMRPWASTVALAAARPKLMLSVWSKKEALHAQLEKGFVPGMEFQFLQGQSPDVEIEETDLLFIDTKHTGTQLTLELSKFAPLVRKYIIRHDTQIFGQRGEDGQPGLLPAIDRFRDEHPEWSVAYQTDRNYGLTVLARDYQPPDETLPGEKLKAIFADKGAPICPACTVLALRMDAWGANLCRERIDAIVDEIHPRAVAWLQSSESTFDQWKAKAPEWAQKLVLRRDVLKAIDASEKA